MLMTALQTKAKKLPEKPAVEQKGFKAFLKKNIYIIIAFFLPFVLMTIGFAIMEVSPFGDKQILVTDLWHQYYPFLVDFQDKLKHGRSLFWSWTQGGGVNYFSLMSYYLAGPMNFLCVFIPSQWLRNFLCSAFVQRLPLQAALLRFSCARFSKRTIFLSLCSVQLFRSAHSLWATIGTQYGLTLSALLRLWHSELLNSLQRANSDCLQLLLRFLCFQTTT